MAAAPDLDAVAVLARLAVPDSARDALADELERLWTWIQELPEPEVAPEVTADGAAPLRPDLPTSSLSADAALREAPEVVEGHFRVPAGGGGR